MVVMVVVVVLQDGRSLLYIIMLGGIGYQKAAAGRGRGVASS